MGYKPPTKHYILEFEDFPGLSVTARGASIGELMDLSTKDIRMAKPEEAREIFDYFADKLVTWNVDHPEVQPKHRTEDGAHVRCGLKEGMQLPTTVDAMFCLDFSFVLRIIFGWMDHLMKVSAPKGLNLPDGVPSPEEWTKNLGPLQSPLTSLEPKSS